jgi:hypothetical protein
LTRDNRNRRAWQPFDDARRALRNLALTTAFVVCLLANANAQTPPVHLFRTTETSVQTIKSAFGDRVLIAGEIDGVELWFHLDTGSTTLALATGVLQKLSALNPPASGVFTADLHVAPFDAANARFQIIANNYRDAGRDVAGIIGAPFFRSNVVTVDFPNQRVLAFPPGSFDPASIAARPHELFLSRSYLPAVDVIWGTTTIRMLVDLGSANTILFLPTANDLIRGDALQSYEPIPLGFGRNPTRLSSYRTVPMKWGRVQVDKPVVLVPDDAPKNLIGDGIQGILGRDIIRNVALTFDYANNLIYF